MNYGERRSKHCKNACAVLRYRCKMTRFRTPLGDYVTTLFHERADGTFVEQITLESEPLELASEPARRDDWQHYMEQTFNKSR